MTCKIRRKDVCLVAQTTIRLMQTEKNSTTKTTSSGSSTNDHMQHENADQNKHTCTGGWTQKSQLTNLERTSTSASIEVDLPLNQANKQNSPTTYRKEAGRPRRHRSARHSIVRRHLVKWTGCRRILKRRGKKKRLGFRKLNFFFPIPQAAAILKTVKSKKKGKRNTIFFSSSSSSRSISHTHFEGEDSSQLLLVLLLKHLHRFSENFKYHNALLRCSHPAHSHPTQFSGKVFCVHYCHRKSSPWSFSVHLYRMKVVFP